LGALQISVLPNPAVRSIQAKFTLVAAEKISLRILSMRGELVQGPITQTLPAGSYVLPFDVSSLAAGSYLLVLSTGKQFQQTIFIKQ